MAPVKLFFKIFAIFSIIDGHYGEVRRAVEERKRAKPSVSWCLGHRWSDPLIGIAQSSWT